LFVDNIKKKIDALGLKESFKDFGIDDYSTMIQDDFIFPLSKVLDKFGIEKDEDVYSQITKRFMLLDDDEDMDADSDLELDADGLDDDEDNEYDNDEDNEDDNDEDDNEDNEDDNNEDNDEDNDEDEYNNKSTQIKKAATTGWVPGVHYIYNEQEEEYYLKYPTIVALATIAGTWMGQNYIDKTWELICYVNNNVDKARENIVNLMTIDEVSRKNMFNTIHKTAVRDITYKLHTQEEKSRILNYKLQEANEKNKQLREKFNNLTKKSLHGNKKLVISHNN
jgi:hypothetical protein